MGTLRNNVHIQLNDAKTGTPIISSGGVAMVCKNGLPTKHTIFSDKDGTSATNPRTLTRGMIDFWVNVADLVNGKVDLYIQTPDDRFIVLRDVVPSGQNEILVHTQQMDWEYVIPFDAADYTAAVETLTGFTEPAANTAVFIADSGTAIIRVTAVHAAKTIDVGTDSGNGGTANGFLSAVSLAALGVIEDASPGALLTTLVGHVSGAKGISLTSSAGTTTAKGFIYLPYRLMQ